MIRPSPSTLRNEGYRVINLVHVLYNSLMLSYIISLIILTRIAEIEISILNLATALSLTIASASDVIDNVPGYHASAIILIEGTTKILNLILFSVFTYALARSDNPEIRSTKVHYTHIYFIPPMIGVIIFSSASLPAWNDQWSGTYSFKGSSSGTILAWVVAMNMMISALAITLAIDCARILNRYMSPAR